MDWMSEREYMYYGILQSDIPVIGFGYSGASEEKDICAACIQIDTEAERVCSDRIKIHFKGNFDINHADREEEMGGFSGTILVAKESSKIVMIGAICSTDSNNAPFARVNLVSMKGFKELFESLRVCFEIHDIEKEEAVTKMRKSIKIPINRHFVYRNKEKSEIRNYLKNDKLVVLFGIGGIGKTELAKSYANEHNKEYDYIYIVSCTISILDGIAEQVEIDGFNRRKIGDVFESNKTYGERKLKWILERTLKILFIFDDVSPKDYTWNKIVSIDQDKIITSRYSKEMWDCSIIEVLALEKLQEQQSLFEKYLERELEKEEVSTFKDIANIVHGHTLILQLIALQCNTSDITLVEMLENLKKQRVYTEDKNEFSYGNTKEERNMYGHIRAIWNLSILSEEEERVMQGLCLLPEQGITRKEYKELMSLDDLNTINSLKKRGWIQEYIKFGKTWIYLHMVVSEVIYSELYRKNPVDLKKFQQKMLKKIKNRSIELSERLRYIAYGEYMAFRLINDLDKAYFLVALSMEEENLRELKKAIEMLEKAEDYIKELGLLENLIAADCYNNMGVVYHTKKCFSKSYDYYKKAEKIYKINSEKYPEKYGLFLHNMARVYLESGKYDEALNIEDIAEKYILKGDKIDLGKVYDVKATYYNHKWSELSETKNCEDKKVIEQICYYMKCEWEMCNKAVQSKQKYCPDDKNEIMLSKSNRAYILAFIGKCKEAKEDINEVFEFYQKTTKEDSIEMGYTYNRMCIIYEKCGECDKACKYVEEAVRIFQKYGESYKKDLEIAKDNLLIAQKL